jgi:hypothetical protein
MSLDKIQQLVGSVTKSLEDSEKLFTPNLVSKLAKSLETYPSDQTLGAMFRVIGKMKDNNTLFIRRADLKQLYTKLFSRNTKFAELFSEELGPLPTLQGSKLMERDDAAELNPYQVGDQVLANALNSVFDKNQPLKLYSQKLANDAKKSVANTLDTWNLRPSKLEVSDGNDKFLVVRADYETPKGISSIYVPLEIRNNQVVEASIFMGNKGPQDLNHANLKQHLITQAGIKSAVTGTAILGILTNAATEHREISGAELALIRLNASRQTQSAFFDNQIVGQKMAQASQKDVELPKSNEFQSFEKQFTSARGQADFKFGPVAKTAREHVVRELMGCGHKNPQVAVAKVDQDTIFYSVALDAGRVGFTVPVKIANGKIVKPTVLLCNGTVSAFSQEGINELYVNNYNDYKAAAVASPQHELSSGDLLNNIRQALAQDNLPAAEDALNVLAQQDNKTAYLTGFQLLINGLSPLTKEASAEKDEAKKSKTLSELIDEYHANPTHEGMKAIEKAKKELEEQRKSHKKHACSMVLKNASSEHPICGHTGLPMHKVYQDQDGNCRPLYRRGMDETYQGAIFNTSKIFW